MRGADAGTRAGGCAGAKGGFRDATTVYPGAASLGVVVPPQAAIRRFRPTGPPRPHGATGESERTVTMGYLSLSYCVNSVRAVAPIQITFSVSVGPSEHIYA